MTRRRIPVMAHSLPSASPTRIRLAGHLAGAVGVRSVARRVGGRRDRRSGCRSGQSNDPVPGNNSDSDPTEVPLATCRSASVSIVITDDLPVGLAFIEATSTQAACAAVGQVVTCRSASSVAVGQVVRVDVKVKVAVRTSIVNNAPLGGFTLVIGRRRHPAPMFSPPRTPHELCRSPIARRRLSDEVHGLWGAFVVNYLP